MNKAALKAKITKALRKGIRATKSDIVNLLPTAFTAGKLYEAYALALICQNLKSKEGCKLILIGSTNITLKSSPGPINAAYPHIRAEKNGSHFANIWTDIEFVGLSAFHSGKAPLTLGDYHEMDVAVVSPGAAGRPAPHEIYLAAECKNTGYQKSLLRETLGVRRELSMLTAPQGTSFTSWPRSTVPANPPSCIIVFSTDPAVLNYAGPGAFFGIDFYHEPV